MRWIRVLAWLGAGLVLLYAALLVWMNHKGSHAWRAAQERLNREGVSLDLAKVEMEPITASENFCAIPVLENIPLVVDGDATKGEPAARRGVLKGIGLPPKHPSYGRPSHTNTDLENAPLDFQEWADWFRETGHAMPVTDPGNPAREVLSALSYQEAPLAEMVAVVDRPKARLLPDWGLRPFPDPLVALQVSHLEVIQHAVEGLTFRAKAAAQSGDAKRAHESALVLARITEATLEEPMVIGLLLGTIASANLTRVVGELGYAHCGTAEDFRKLQQALERHDLRRAGVRAFKAEVATGVDVAFYVQRSRNFVGRESGEKPMPAALGMVIPSGWFEANAASIADLSLDYLIIPLRDRGWKDAIAERRRLEDLLRDMKAESRYGWILDKLFTSRILPSFVRIVDRAAYGQCLLDQSIIACALERYRIERGSYPDSLNDLARPGEKPLPLDIVSGTPMRYRKTDNGRYVLWAVGFDGVDDNGMKPTGKSGRYKPHHTEYKGDWVWDFPTPEQIRAAAPEPAPRTKSKRLRPKRVPIEPAPGNASPQE
jgi:hypothetical protein